MKSPKVMVFAGNGINCDDDTAFAFEQEGANVEYGHLRDLELGMKKFEDYQVLAFPGGFSDGDDTGAGNAFSNRIRTSAKLYDRLQDFVGKDKLVLGICNGFQILANLGLVGPVPNTHEYGSRKVALVYNDFPRYKDVWVDLDFTGNQTESPWLLGIGKASFPIAHGEGKFYTDAETLDQINQGGLVAAKYIHGKICKFEHRSLEDANPNGSLDDIAGITDETGRVLGLMPHPERAIDFTHYPNWRNLKAEYGWKVDDMPERADGMRIFDNAVRYFE